MAEILIKAVDAVHTDSAKDRRGCYKRGYPVVVMPDGHPWGLEERLPRFWLVKLPGVPVARLARYIAEWDTIDVNNERQPVQRRRWKVRFELLPASVQSKLTTTGVLTVAVGPGGDISPLAFRNRLFNEETGLVETEGF